VKIGLVVKLIISLEMNFRWMDMETQRDGYYWFILVYKNQLMKYVSLKSLKLKRIEYLLLLYSFTSFWDLCMLHSDVVKN